jgi:hypothetical protein
MAGRVGVVIAVGAMLVGCGSGSAIHANSGSNGGQFAVGAAGSYQWTVTLAAFMGGQADLELANNDVACEGCLPAGSPWEVQLPIADGETTATGTIYLIAGNYTAIPDYQISWSLTLSPSA